MYLILRFTYASTSARKTSICISAAHSLECRWCRNASLMAPGFVCMCLYLCIACVFFQAIQERMFNWEQLVKIVNVLRTQIQVHSKCRLKAVSNSLDQLTQRNNLTMKQREELLTGIHKAFWENMEHHEDGKHCGSLNYWCFLTCL